MTTSKNKIPQSEKDIIDRTIVKLRVEKSLSLKQTCIELNELGYRTPTKKQWDKPKLSSYIKHMKLDVGKD